MLGYVLSGGFLKGYRTYIAAGVIVLSGIASYLIGDTDLATTITTIATGLGFGALRAK
jgi:hypothetical protein